MTEKLKQKTKELLEIRPTEVKEAVDSINWGELCEKIARENKITEENEINALQIEVMLILTGVETISILEINLEHNLEIGKELAKKIKEEIANQILNPVVKKIKEIVKEKQKNKKATWQQNINFILSNGDYSVFLRTENQKNNLQEKPTPEKTPINYSKIEDLKNNFTI